MCMNTISTAIGLAPPLLTILRSLYPNVIYHGRYMLLIVCVCLALRNLKHVPDSQNEPKYPSKQLQRGLPSSLTVHVP